MRNEPLPNQVHVNPAEQTITGLNPDQFIESANKLLDLSLKENWCKEHLLEQIYQLVQTNPDPAKSLGFPTEYSDITRQIVEPWYGERENACEDNSNKTQSGAWQCFMDNKWELFRSSVGCGFTIAFLPIPIGAVGATGLAISCGTFVESIIKCAIKN